LKYDPEETALNWYKRGEIDDFWLIMQKIAKKNCCTADLVSYDTKHEDRAV
jgi:hypothetical protein